MPSSSPDVSNKHTGCVLMEVVEDTFKESPSKAFSFLNDNELRRRVYTLLSGFVPLNPHAKIAYSVKANSDRNIIKTVSQLQRPGCFDCATPGEIVLVRDVDPGAMILYNNPIHSDEDIREAAAMGVRHYTAQTMDGVDNVLSNATCSLPEEQIELSIRLRTEAQDAIVDFSPKLGAYAEYAEEMLNFLKTRTRVAPGLCTHTGSQNANPQSYRDAIKEMAVVASKVGGVKNFNIGGGFPANYYGYPSFEITDYLAAINAAIRECGDEIFEGYDDYQIFTEPGRYIAAEAIDLVIPVIAEELRDGVRCIYIADGRFTSFGSAMLHNFRINFRALKLTEDGVEELPPSPKEGVNIFDMTCDGRGDLKLQDELGTKYFMSGSIGKGDYLWCPSAGAYTSKSVGTEFCGIPLPRLVTYNTSPGQIDLELIEGISSDSKYEDFFENTFVTADGLTDGLVREAADYYRFVFNNYWPDLVVCPQCDINLPTGMRKSAREVYRAGKSIVPVDVFDDLKVLPCCPNCGDEMQILHDPETVFNRIKDKLSQNGHLFAARNKATKRLGAFTFGYAASLGEILSHEWPNHFPYMSSQSGEYAIDPNTFIKRLSEEFEDPELSADSEFYCWNSLGVGPEIQKMRKLWKVMQGFFGQIPPEMHHLPVIGEVRRDEKAYQMHSKIIGVREVEGILTEPSIIMVANLGNLVKTFNRSPEEFARL